MHIIISNNKLTFGDYKLKCAVGKRGIKLKRREGDNITPIGNYKVVEILYRKDRVSEIISKIKKRPIKKNMGWCNDPSSIKYNRLITFPFNYSAEKLYRKDNTYDIIIVLNYNYKPTLKGKGSAIFIHVAKKNYSKTQGCIAIEKKNLIKLISKIQKTTKVKIF